MPPHMRPATLIPDEPGLTLSEAASILGLHYTTALGLITSGQLRAVKIGKRWRTYRSWINEYLLARQNVSEGAADARLDPIVIPNSEEEVAAGLARHGVEFAD